MSKRLNEESTFSDHRQTCENVYVCMSHLTCAFQLQNWFWQCQCSFRFTMWITVMWNSIFVLFLSNVCMVFYFSSSFICWANFILMHWLILIRTVCVFNVQYRHLIHRFPKTIYIFPSFVCSFVCLILMRFDHTQHRSFCWTFACLVEHAFFISHCDAITI